MLGCVAPPLFVADSLVQGYWPPDFAIAVVAGMIAGVWGAVGGLVAGALCATVARALERRAGRTTATQYSRIAALTTVALATPVSILQLADGGVATGGVATLWDVAVWLLIPVSMAAVAAKAVGAWIWRRRGNTARVAPV